MSNIIVFNRNNIVQGTNNSSMIYNFPNSVDLTNASIAVSQVNMYYSWQNINASPLDNNKFSYVWYDATMTPQTYPVILPDGLYEIKDINSYMQFTFINNGHYLVNDQGQYVYYAEWVVNASQYAVQLNTFPVPTSLPALWTNPGALVFPSQTFNPSISTPPNFNLIVGFSPTFTSSPNLGIGTNLSYLSTKAPDVQPNSSLLISLSNIHNIYSNPSSIIYSVVPNVNFGELISDKAVYPLYNRMLPGTYNQLRLQFLSPTFQPLSILDPNITILLTIKDLKGDYADVAPFSQNTQQISRGNLQGSGFGHVRPR
jgi:hypothetical protein